MYHSVEEFVKDWTYEVEGTQKLLENMTDASLDQRVSEDGRSLGRIAWHLVLTIPEMMRRTGLPVEGPHEDASPPKTVTEISQVYQQASDSLVQCLRADWTDASLEDEVNLYGDCWKKGFVLQVLAFHQCHHRGQMTVLMRQAGLKVPGIYGPAREEWAAVGMPPQE